MIYSQPSYDVRSDNLILFVEEKIYLLSRVHYINSPLYDFAPILLSGNIFLMAFWQSRYNVKNICLVFNLLDFQIVRRKVKYSELNSSKHTKNLICSSPLA